MRINWPVLIAGFLLILLNDPGQYNASSTLWQDPTPTLIPPLVSFSVVSGDQQVVLEWETEEIGGFSGFYVTRSLEIEGEYTRISPFISIHENNNDVSYSYTDSPLTNGLIYSYILEILALDETSTFSLPVQASPQAPTSTFTPSLTHTASATQTDTPTSTSTSTPTLTSTLSPTANHTPTQTPSSTPTGTASPTNTATQTPSPTSSYTPTPTYTVTITPTKTITRTPPRIFRTPSPIPARPFITITINPNIGTIRTPDPTSPPSPTRINPSIEQTLLAGNPILSPTQIPKKPLASSTRTIFWSTLAFGGLISFLVLLGGLGIHLFIRQR